MYLYGPTIGEPSEAEIRQFQHDKAYVARSAAQSELNRKLKEIRTIPFLQKYTLEEEVSAGDRCYAESVGATLVSGYFKACYLRKGILLSTRKPLKEVTRELNQYLGQFDSELDPFILDRSSCMNGKIDTARASEGAAELYREAYVVIGSVGDKTCLEEVDQLHAFASNPHKKGVDITAHTFDSRRIRLTLEAENKVAYLFIAFDNKYFDELMKGNI
jgi:hypothetical protein